MHICVFGFTAAAKLAKETFEDDFPVTAVVPIAEDGAINVVTVVLEDLPRVLDAPATLYDAVSMIVDDDT